MSIRADKTFGRSSRSRKRATETKIARNDTYDLMTMIIITMLTDSYMCRNDIVSVLQVLMIIVTTVIIVTMV